MSLYGCTTAAVVCTQGSYVTHLDGVLAAAAQHRVLQNMRDAVAVVHLKRSGATQ